MKTAPYYPPRRRNTKQLLVSLLFSLAVLAVVMFFASCTLSPIGDANPLDRPVDHATARELHEGNIQNITNNPGYHLP